MKHYFLHSLEKLKPCDSGRIFKVGNFQHKKAYICIGLGAFCFCTINLVCFPLISLSFIFIDVLRANVCVLKIHIFLLPLHTIIVCTCLCAFATCSSNLQLSFTSAFSNICSAIGTLSVSKGIANVVEFVRNSLIFFFFLC